MTRLLSPGRGGGPGRAIDVEIADDQVRERVVITLRRERGPRQHLVATTEEALDVALALVEGALRLRGGMS